MLILTSVCPSQAKICREVGSKHTPALLILMSHLQMNSRERR